MGTQMSISAQRGSLQPTPAPPGKDSNSEERSSCTGEAPKHLCLLDKSFALQITIVYLVYLVFLSQLNRYQEKTKRLCLFALHVIVSVTRIGLGNTC